uniref:Putative secreted protein n=1 Tax=Amblyomma americanum TaxID=6943 RepID=A0A0C9R3V4_AMBAM
MILFAGSRSACVALLVFQGLTLSQSKPNIHLNARKTIDDIEVNMCNQTCCKNNKWACSRECFCFIYDKNETGTCISVDDYPGYVEINDTSVYATKPIKYTK